MKKIRINKIWLFLVIFGFVANNSGAQKSKLDETMIGLHSPNVASLGNYGDIQPSLYTGSINPIIPIYTIKTQNIEIPIALSYYSGGVRVNQHSGWVGLNWSLQAGGVISRKINGYPDEYDDRKGGGASGIENGFMWNYRMWSSDLGFLNQYKATYDIEPDEFSFNFLNYSGTFYLNTEGKWSVYSDNNIKVIFDIEKDLRELTQDETGPGASKKS